MSHVMFGGLTHENAVVLCDRLAALALATSEVASGIAGGELSVLRSVT